MSIRVTLVEGHGEAYWPRPGRIFAASRSHTFAQLASAIDLAFARWDHNHLHCFDLLDGTKIGVPEPYEEPGTLDGAATKLSRLALGEKFAYEFDYGDCWRHLCEVAHSKVDPLETYGSAMPDPVPYWGWGAMPDQYLRRFETDDGEARPPRELGYKDLPPPRPFWGR